MELKKHSNKGRWTQEEKKKFIEYYTIFGKNWKKIKKFINTRSLVQIRSFAQKYIKTLNKKNFNNLENININYNIKNFYNENSYNSYHYDFENEEIYNLNTNTNTNIISNENLDLWDININFNFNDMSLFEKSIDFIENINKILVEITGSYNIERKKANLLYLKNILFFFKLYIFQIMHLEKYINYKEQFNKMINIINNKLLKIEFYESNLYSKYILNDTQKNWV